MKKYQVGKTMQNCLPMGLLKAMSKTPAKDTLCPLLIDSRM